MKNAALWLVVLNAGVAQAAPARIDSSFPPLDERRSPDRTVPHEGGAPARLAYSADGRVVATVSAKGKAVRLYNARTGEQGTGEMLRELPAGADVAGLGFRASAKVVVVGADRSVKVFDAATGALVREGKAPPSGNDVGKLAAALVRPGEAPHIALVEAAAVTLFDDEAGKPLWTQPLTGKPTCAAFRPDGKQLVVGSGGEVAVLDAATGKPVRTVSASKVATCALGDKAIAVATVEGGKSELKVWDLGGEASPRLFPTGKGALAALAFASKGDALVGGGADRRFRVWDVPSATTLATYEGHAGPVTSVVFNPNNQKLASGGDKTLRFWTVPLPPLPAADRDKIDAAAAAVKARVAAKSKRKLLVFWRADAILHKGGVPAVNHVVAELAKRTGAFTAHFSRDYEVFTPKILAGYDAILMNSTAHISLPDEAKQKAFLGWAAAGHGVVGVHAAIDMWRRWPEGAAVIGATFGGHPWHPSGTWSVKLDEPAHPLLAAFGGKAFKMHDEFYELGEPFTRKDRRVLLSLDTRDPVTANVTPLHRADRDFAVAWVKRYQEGRVFYAMFGHIADPFFDAKVQQFYLDGIQYALGDLDADAAPKADPPAKK